MDQVSALSDAQKGSATGPLFRSQALDHVKARQYGTVILVSPVSHRILTALFVSIALCIIGFFILFSTTRKARGTGVLLPTTGVIRVTPMQGGVITEKRVKEGQAVKAGQVMFVLSSERSSASSESTEKKFPIYSNVSSSVCGWKCNNRSCKERNEWRQHSSAFAIA